MGYLGSKARRAARQMMPHRVLWRFAFSGRAFPSRRRVKARFAERTVATGSREDYERMRAAAGRPAKKTAASKTAVTKVGGKGRGDVYAAARQIPARNQAAAKKTAAGSKKKTAAGRVQVPRRNPDGTFDGSVSFPSFGPREQAAYERALRGQVDPVQHVRQPRRRK
jgi:hypothetical protein